MQLSKTIFSSVLVLGVLAGALAPAFSSAQAPSCRCIAFPSAEKLRVATFTQDWQFDRVVAVLNQPSQQTGTGAIAGFSVWVNGVQANFKPWAPLLSKPGSGEHDVAVVITLDGIDLKNTDKVEVQYTPSLTNRIRSKIDPSRYLDAIAREVVVNGSSKDALCPMVGPYQIDDGAGGTDAVLNGYFSESMKTDVNDTLQFTKLLRNGAEVPASGYMGIVMGTNFVAMPNSGSWGFNDAFEVGTSFANPMRDLNGNPPCPTEGTIKLTKPTLQVVDTARPEFVSFSIGEFSSATAKPNLTLKVGQTPVFYAKFSEPVTPTSSFIARTNSQPGLSRWVKFTGDGSAVMRGKWIGISSARTQDRTAKLKFKQFFGGTVRDKAGNTVDFAPLSLLTEATIPGNITDVNVKVE